MFITQKNLKEFDPELWSSINNETSRQEEHIELIASENYTSKSILEVQGSVLTNKYAEGYPGKRYYGGCEHVDVAESLAIERAKELYGAAYANVQPHSGASANSAVYLALCEAGDSILGMSLDHGGHLTHGAKVNFSGKTYESFQYGLDSSTGELNYQEVEDLAKKHNPKMIVAGFSAYSGIVDWERFRKIADSVDAYLLVDMAHVSGLVAAGEYPSPIPYADVVTTTTHKTLRGPRGGLILAKENEEIHKKLNSAIFPGTQGGPLMNIIAAKAQCFVEASEPAFGRYIDEVIDNARTMAKVFMKAGYNVITGGTDSHVFLLDLSDKKISGREAADRLEENGITVNKNGVPNDPRNFIETSGIRIGTAAETTKNRSNYWFENLAEMMIEILEK